MTPEQLHDQIALEFGDVMPILSKALRSMFVATLGSEFCGADFSNIEGRINAWFANEEWKLQAFKDYDAGIGSDLYRVAYSKSFGIVVEMVTKAQRQVGKTEELALGFQGSIGAWLRFDPNPIVVTRVISEQFRGTDTWRKAEAQYDAAHTHFGLEADQWISIKVVVNSWREANGSIVQSWWDLQDAAIAAVDSPSEVVPVLDGKVQYLASDGFLWCRLPSGKLLAYASPRLVETKEKWLVDADGESFPAEEFTADEIAARVALGAKIQSGRTRTQVQFEGKNQKTGVWGKQRLYGGLQCNNVIQGTARELLRFAMHNVEVAGYPIMFHVHDEIVSEITPAFGSVDHFQNLVSILPPWLQGLPLAAKAWSAHRYVK